MDQEDGAMFKKALQAARELLDTNQISPGEYEVVSRVQMSFLATEAPTDAPTGAPSATTFVRDSSTGAAFFARYVNAFFARLSAVSVMAAAVTKARQYQKSYPFGPEDVRRTDGNLGKRKPILVTSEYRLPLRLPALVTSENRLPAQPPALVTSENRLPAQTPAPALSTSMYQLPARPGLLPARPGLYLCHRRTSSKSVGGKVVAEAGAEVEVALKPGREALIGSGCRQDCRVDDATVSTSHVAIVVRQDRGGRQVVELQAYHTTYVYRKGGETAPAEKIAQCQRTELREGDCFSLLQGRQCLFRVACRKGAAGAAQRRPAQPRRPALVTSEPRLPTLPSPSAAVRATGGHADTAKPTAMKQQSKRNCAASVKLWAADSSWIADAQCC
jgi:hypothetical protein